jgi:hypothetical protein
MPEVADSYYVSAMWEVIEKWSGSQKIGCVVEIGTYEGMWASGLLSRFDVERYFAIDPWHGDNTKEWDRHLRKWMQNLEEWLWKSVFPLRGTSNEWARVFPYSIDLLYIDGLHKLPAVRRDLASWYPKLREGGLIIGHDLNNRNVRIAVREFLSSYEVVQAGPPHGSIITQAFWRVK